MINASDEQKAVGSALDATSSGPLEENDPVDDLNLEIGRRKANSAKLTILGSLPSIKPATTSVSQRRPPCRSLPVGHTCRHSMYLGYHLGLWG